jgi:hypothetical protein
MKEIKIDISPRQMANLRKGKPVRMRGGGIPMYVDTDTYNRMSRSFLSGKGIQHALSPAEIAHNEGMGIFKKVKKTAINTAKKVGRQVVKRVVPLAGVAGATAGAYLGGPAGAMVGKQAGDMAGDYLGGEALDLLKTKKGRANAPRSRGPATDPLASAGMGDLAERLALAGIDQMRARVRDNQSPSPMLAGRGFEKGSIGIGGNIVSNPPSSMSQPYSANFQFRHFLPPAYANISKRAGGAGLYAQGGRGLYAAGGSGLYAQGRGLYA